MLVFRSLRFTGVFPRKTNVCRLIFTHDSYADADSQAIKFSPDRLVRVYGFGVAATGALGMKQYIEPKRSLPFRPRFTVSVPTHLNYMSVNSIDVKSIACGYGFTTFIGSHPTMKRAVYGCGINSDGQLGVQTNQIHGSISESFDVSVVPEPHVIPIPQEEGFLPLLASCGRAHSIIVLQNTNSTHAVLFSLGNNTYGQCAREVIEGEIFTAANAQVTKVLLPPELEIIKQVECGQDHTLVLSSKGEVFSAGLSTDGQTGLGSTDSVDKLTKIGGALDGLHVKQVSSRGDTALALTECGRVFAWGNNEYSQIWPVTDEVQVLEPIELPIHQCLANLGLGRVTQVAAAGSMCGLLDEHGHVLVWGFGCLGLGPKTLHCSKPTLIPPALFSPALPFSDNRITDLVPGLHHFIARSSCGLLWSWGAPRGGLACLGLGRNSTSSTQDATKNVQTYPVPLSLPGEALKVACGPFYSSKKLCHSSTFYLQAYSGFRSRLLPVCLRCSYSQAPTVKRCYYAVLEVSPTASSDVIRTAYYTKCKATHPDVASTDSKDFLEVNEAYTVLMNPELRRAYDNTRRIVQHEGNDLSSFFSCSPDGPKITFDRASEIFHARKFRRRFSEAPWPDCQLNSNKDALRW
ncbi:unnamed protein product [Hydatigera taeniaeformis]|uniref:J domain-containing protein n=1 Tax=Hydatigena taeniaeformis TaxID=6205 RepID=A0A0R3X2L1_HYDTA|nr:unnamed protein product [Hydatigera taeniaeformis]